MCCCLRFDTSIINFLDLLPHLLNVERRAQLYHLESGRRSAPTLTDPVSS